MICACNVFWFAATFYSVIRDVGEKLSFSVAAIACLELFAPTPIDAVLKRDKTVSN
jgi:hypothetical protein